MAMQAMNQKIFVLGVGAPKAGTTWLHRYLQSKKNVSMGFTKEYQIWDAISVPECSNYIVSWRGCMRGTNNMKRWLMQKSPYFYFYYFANLLSRRDVDLVGDITPAYSALTREVFKQIKTGFEKHGIKVKVVFLMRDPVDRCLSSFSMNIRRNKFQPAVGSRPNVDWGDEFLAFSRHPTCKIRTNYHKTIQELEKVFDKSDLYYGFYENMFEQGEIDRLSSFLHVDSDSAFREQKFNYGSKISVDTSSAMEVAREYKDVYRFILPRFPQVDGLWAYSKYAQD
jgi:hypothetical protein